MLREEMNNMDKYSKIAEGLTAHYTTKARQRMAEKAELNFNRSEDAYNKALNSKDGEYISKIVDALIKQREELYSKIFQNGGKNDADIVAYKELTAKLEKLEIHVNNLHEEGEI